MKLWLSNPGHQNFLASLPHTFQNAYNMQRKHAELVRCTEWGREPSNKLEHHNTPTGKKKLKKSEERGTAQ
jgi:hypothetical protein